MVQAVTQNTNTATLALPVPETQRFVQGNRIHVAGGSQFLDAYLVVHPRELKPENAGALRAKLELTYGLNNPSFYESPERLPIALNLASLLPASLEAKRSALMREIEKFNTETRTRVDADLAQTAADRARPFTAILRDTLNEPAADPVGMEMLKNGLNFYLLLRESLTRHGYLGKLNDYVRFNETPDQILTSLQDKIGVSSEVLMEAARTQGLLGLSRALGLEDTYLQESQALIEKASRKEFSYNMIEHWHLGRQLLRDKPNATLDDKIAVGYERRIQNTMTQLRAETKGQTDVPPAIKAKEQWVAQGLGLVPAIQRQLLWDLGYEISYTDEPTADKIAKHPSIYGLHRSTKDNQTDLRGTYRIYFGSKGDPEGAHRTLVHEVTHDLWPSMFSEQDAANIDKLANMDRARIKTVAQTLRAQFDVFSGYMDAYNAPGANKADILARANAHFGSTLGKLDNLFAENKNPYEVLDMAEHADQRLHIDGLLYKQSGYNGPQERFREVISRYAELRYVRLRTEPALMNFLAPGLGQVYDNYYLPHLERLHQKIVANQNVAAGRTAIAADEVAETGEKKPTPMPEIAEQGKKQAQPEVANLGENPVSIESPKVDKPVVQQPVIEQPVVQRPAIQAPSPAADNDNHEKRDDVVTSPAKIAASHSGEKKTPGTLVHAATVMPALKALKDMGISA